MNFSLRLTLQGGVGVGERGLCQRGEGGGGGKIIESVDG